MNDHHSLSVRLASFALAVLLLTATVGPAVAVSPPAASPVFTTTVDSSDRAAITAFFERELPASMARNDVPGGVLTVVHDGEVILLEGYGHADVETATPVDPHTTVFHTGSVAKVVTTTGVVQLADAGVVDVDTDVTEYVDVELTGRDDGPITLRHLATHTAGFDYVNDGVLTSDPASVPTVETIVQSELPQRVRAPGTVSTYDNHGWTLMGYVLEQQSGRSYADYTQQELFTPLGMHHSSSSELLSADLNAALATGYHVENGEPVVADPAYVRLAPAGSFATTGADMGQFLQLNLEDGCVDGACLLTAESVDELHTTQFRGHPAVTGMAFGYEEYDRNGQRVLGKGGDTGVFSADLWLLPDHDLGVFMAFNAPGGAYVRHEVYTAFMNEFFPVEATATGAVAGFDDRVADMVGEYRLSRVSETDHTRFLGLIEVVSVRAVDDGVVSLSIGGQTVEYAEVEPYVFVSPDDGSRLAFVSHDDGEKYLFASAFAADHLVRIAPVERPLLQFVLLGGSALVVVSAVVGWPAAALFRRVRREWHARTSENAPSTGATRSDGGSRFGVRVPGARWLVGAAGVTTLGTFVGLVYLLSTDSLAFATGSHPLLGPVTALPIVAGLLLIAGVSQGLSTWSTPDWSRRSKIHFALVAAGVGVLLAALAVYNLVMV